MCCKAQFIEEKGREIFQEMAFVYVITNNNNERQRERQKKKEKKNDEKNRFALSIKKKNDD